MPQNNELPINKSQVKTLFGVKPKTKFKNNLDAINVKLVDAPSINQLMNYVPGMLLSTWAEDVNSLNTEDMTNEEKISLIYECFSGKSLPTPLETVGLTFLISGIDLITVTHILRYRTASFAAVCSGDRFLHFESALVPNSIQNSPEFYERYKKIVEDSKQLYADMIDTKEISIMDARHILSRCLENHYYMRINLKDFIHLVKQRIDTEIQPEEDNVLAYNMWLEVLKYYPFLVDLIDIDEPAYFFIKTAKEGKASKLYIPDEKNDKFEWNINDFVYSKKRKEMNGTIEGTNNYFEYIFKQVKEKIALVKEYVKSVYPYLYENR